MRVFRISKSRYAQRALDGEGARRYGGRWNHPGRPVVYTSSSAALASLELLVHLDHDEVPQDLALIEVDVPDDIGMDVVGQLPKTWRRSPAPLALQDLGNAWLELGPNPVLRVPSAVVPTEYNFLLNPEHDLARRFRVVRVAPFALDPRLLPT